MTSATDNRTTELRKLLDERGVEYDETTEYVTTAYFSDKVVRYYGYDGDFSVEVIFPRPYLNNTEWLTPEQAIAATLGNDGVEQSNDGVAELQAENAKLRELVWDVYCLAYPRAVEWEVSDAVYDKYSPCEKCHELHGGKSPCASTSKDMTEECCEPIQAAVVADRMRALGLEVD